MGSRDNYDFNLGEATFLSLFYWWVRGLAFAWAFSVVWNWLIVEVLHVPLANFAIGLAAWVFLSMLSSLVRE